MAIRKLGKTYSKEEFIKAVANSFSIAETLRKLGLNVSGANYRTVRLLVSKLNLDIKHWTGQSHLKGKTHSWAVKRPLNQILVENSTYISTYHLKNRLLKEKLLEEKCYDESCDVGNTWNGKKLILHLDHRNGNNTDNRIENLRLLCPNCHSQTDTYAGKNIGNYKN